MFPVTEIWEQWLVESMISSCWGIATSICDAAASRPFPARGRCGGDATFRESRPDTDVLGVLRPSSCPGPGAHCGACVHDSEISSDDEPFDVRAVRPSLSPSPSPSPGPSPLLFLLPVPSPSVACRVHPLELWWVLWRELLMVRVQL